MSHTWTKRLLILGVYIPLYPPSVATPLRVASSMQRSLSVGRQLQLCRPTTDIQTSFLQFDKQQWTKRGSWVKVMRWSVTSILSAIQCRETTAPPGEQLPHCATTSTARSVSTSWTHCNCYATQANSAWPSIVGSARWPRLLLENYAGTMTEAWSKYVAHVWSSKRKKRKDDFLTFTYSERR